MKHVLVVDHDTTSLKSISAALAEYPVEFVLATAAGATEAIALLRVQAVDLLCVDLGILTMPDLPLLTYLLEHAPDLPLIVLTSQDLESLPRHVTGLGSLVFCQKPLSLLLLIGLVSTQRWLGAPGEDNGRLMVNVLQLLHLGKKTCIVTLRSDGREGVLAFRAGQLSSATYGDVSGAAALDQLLGWRRPAIRIADDMFFPWRTINTPFAQTLAEAVQRGLTMSRGGAEPAPGRPRSAHGARPGTSPEPDSGANGKVGPDDLAARDESQHSPGTAVGDELPSSLLSGEPASRRAESSAEIGDATLVLAADSTGAEGRRDAGALSEASPSARGALSDRASAAVAEGDKIAASAYISAMLAQDPLSVMAHFLLARLHEQQGDFDQAIAVYRRTVFLERGFVPGHIGMASGFKALGRHVDMQRCYSNALNQLALLPPDTVIPELGGEQAQAIAAKIAREKEVTAC